VTHPTLFGDFGEEWFDQPAEISDEVLWGLCGECDCAPDHPCVHRVAEVAYEARRALDRMAAEFAAFRARLEL